MTPSQSDELGTSMDILPGSGLSRDEKKLNSIEPMPTAGPEDENKDKTTNAFAFLDIIGVMFQSSVPTFISWGLSMGLIFGGCCSNVFALEAIVKEEPESGLLITFTQFVVTFLLTWPRHFSSTHRPWYLKTPAVPLLRWVPNMILFFSVNMLNNFAFGYDISVPVHIILRSGGSVTTILVGWIWGKRFSRMQVVSVGMLTVGIIIAAMADAQSKVFSHRSSPSIALCLMCLGQGKSSASSASSTEASTTTFLTGLSILFIAQVLSAIMGLYTQSTYAIYGPHWSENLFYSHFLSLPLFLPFALPLYAQFKRLLDSPLLELSLLPSGQFQSIHEQPFSWIARLVPSWLYSTEDYPLSLPTLRIPVQLLTLVLNSLTQYACIRGVNLLGARSSALGVTIVLNVRKLVSLFISIWVFGNELPIGVMLGAAVVFASGAVYAWEGSRTQKEKHKSG
ncbi:golgi uridine diphosphate-N- acetylglucosamine transporter [Xylographa soralifera]|nr:golgi uridine diphosphate-N- acetylglucosamine transporter [Xylographa soralifera]